MKMARKMIVFYYNGKEILSMTAKGMCAGEIPATIGLLAYERGIPESCITFAEVTR